MASRAPGAPSSCGEVLGVGEAWLEHRDPGVLVEREALALIETELLQQRHRPWLDPARRRAPR
jgi:hypothetical protein